VEKIPDSRLQSAVPYIRQGAIVADIGTDHAYLPIELVRRGVAKRAVACDINRGPIERAAEHIKEAGLEGLIDTLQTDGLLGVEHYSPDHILIFGMGGELIARILSDADWVRNECITLVLQPMTRAETLRRWLLSSGFSIVGETVSFEEQYYQTICARFGGKTETYSEGELLIGKHYTREMIPYLIGMITRRIDVLAAAAEGKKKGNQDISADEALIGELSGYLSRLKEEKT
jgi:tRNA (adenine22-N1)-methyltransferase